MLDKTYYFDEAHFEKEHAEIFTSNWIFACLKSEVSVNSDFVTFDVAGIPVVVQNFKGELRAFQNICSHRFNKIQTEPFGRRALTCGYHCWSFDKEGYPSFIPKKTQFTEFGDEQLIHDNFCLKKFHIDTCGNFVFICLADTKPVELMEHLGEYCQKLEEISAHMGAKTHFGVLNHKANWKILVENVLECYHCSIVHNTSLYGKLGVGGLPISDIEYSALHSSCHFPKAPKKSDEKKRKILAFLDERSLKHNSFYHIYIFPNLVISSTEGNLLQNLPGKPI
jgi:choline monooxygenase